MLSVLIGVLFSLQSDAATSGVLIRDGALWTTLSVQERCDLIRAVLDARQPKAKYSIADSSCLRDYATWRGRLIVNVAVRWDDAGERIVEGFPVGRGGTCGWSDVVFFQNVPDRKTEPGKRPWQVALTLYPMSKNGDAQFAFFSHVVPAFPLRKNSWLFSGCGDDYGYVRRTGGAWTATHDYNAKAWVPLAPRQGEQKRATPDTKAGEHRR